MAAGSVSIATIYAFGPFRLDLQAEMLSRGKEPVAIGRRAVALLRMLVERPGAPVSKDALIEGAWSGRAVEENNLTVQIAALRRVLGEAGGTDWIETMPRRGYRFVGPLVAKEQNADATGPTMAVTLPDRPSIAALPFIDGSCDAVGPSSGLLDPDQHPFAAAPIASLRGIASAREASAISNIPIRVPMHFMGRDDALASILARLACHEGRVAITALHGLRGVGKTTLAAAYAEHHRGDYRATWWIRAQTEPTMRADFAALGVRLGWVGAEDKEEPAVAAVMERLRYEGNGILLIYDNAVDARALEPYLPRGGTANVLVTSNAHAWRGIAAPVEIHLWPNEIGADYLIARTGRDDERAAAEALSEALGGLPLAHEQAAAYCERLDIPLAEYRTRFEAAPARFLDDTRHAPAEYHDGLTVAKTFALAIAEAAKLHPAAEPLIVHAALLAPEPIPLFLFAEAREKFGEPLARSLAGDGLDEAVAALRCFSLVDREMIRDERDPTAVTATIRLHRLVRQVAAHRREGAALTQARRALGEAVAAIYPDGVLDDPKTWPRARRLDALALDLVDVDAAPPQQADDWTANLLNGLALYRQGPLATFALAQPLYERALAIRENLLGPDHPDTAQSLHNLANLLQDQGDFVSVQPLHERALAIRERVLGTRHPDTAQSLNSLAMQLVIQGDFANAGMLLERALAIRQETLGPEHPATAQSLNNLARVLQMSGNIVGAASLLERALVIREKALGPEHPATGKSLSNLARMLQAKGDLAGARPLFERALAISEKVVGAEHPATAQGLSNLARMLQAQGDLAGARPLSERALAIREKVLGAAHPITALSLSHLAGLLLDLGDLAAARPLQERSLAILEVIQPDHPFTNRARYHLARLHLAEGNAADALKFSEVAVAAHEKALGVRHRFTRDSARIAADALAALGRAAEAAVLRGRYGMR
ncbi:FxSxx-COOH system tetratricopeptide repeat protein [Bradyrhizobium sp.]|uniref:FxSxx-COOH system tetratricopeptide repeat protein n=1 Tax=Bradyrhizobium sp. TaxID=376 RepID=UPI003C1BDEB1